MGIRTENGERQQLIFLSLFLLLLGLFVSRVLLSLSTVFFLLLTCVHSGFRSHLRRFFHTPLLWGMTILFLLPFVSGLWSEDKEWWWRFVRIKLPLLILPFCFAGRWQLSAGQWRQLAHVFLLLLFLGCSWSLWNYLQSPKDIHEGYLRAKVMATPLQNDHVRYSLLVGIGVITSTFLYLQQKSGRGLMIAAGIFFILYLHILSARTGLAALYIFLVAAVACVLFVRRPPRRAFILPTLLVLLPLLAWFALPTFQNRIRYFLYDLSLVQKGQFVPGANDGNRVLSLRAGCHLLKNHPLGVGAGDVVPLSRRWYTIQQPTLPEKDMLFPSSEWLMYGGTAGWPGFLLFTLVMILPFLSKGPHRFFWWTLNAIMAFSFLFDIGLEVQFGVYAYVFIILWWWKWTRQEPLNGIRADGANHSGKVHQPIDVFT